MEYTCITARFTFFNGDKTFTVEFHYGVMTWYVFNDYQDTNALFFKRVNPSKTKTPTRDRAMDILFEYLDSITVN